MNNNIVLTDYERTVYSGGAENKILIVINDDNFFTYGDDKCEKLTVKTRFLPENNNGVFALNNFVSKEATLIMHDVYQISQLMQLPNNTVDITISTKVNGTWEDVKIGKFNISSIEVTDKNKCTLKLRDNSVKFDFNYNAKEVIDQNGGVATLLQIFQDIITKSGVPTEIEHFDNDDMAISIYDNTITARKYINYMAEQAGLIPIINRNGYLEFVQISVPQSFSECICIPLSIVEKYELGNSYAISKVVFQDGSRDFESGDDLANKLYIDASNPYIISQDQIDNIKDKMYGFQMISTKTGKILGNPKINPNDYVLIYDDENGGTITAFPANYTLTYTGVMTMTFDVDVKATKMQENITTVGESVFRRWVKTEINNEKNEITFQAGRIDTIDTNVSNLNGEVASQNQIINSVEQRITETENRVTVISTNIDEETGQIQSVQNTIGKFDKDGLSIEKSGSATKSLLDEAGLEIDDNLSGSNEMLFYAGYVNDEKIAKESSLADYKDKTLVYTKDLLVKEYITLPNGRFENINDNDYGDGVGIFI